MKTFWQSKLLAQFPELVHGSTSMDYGCLRYGRGGDSEAYQNRIKIANEFGFDMSYIYVLDQVHGNEVISVSKGDKGNADLPRKELKQADGLLCSVPGRTLVIETADCVPVLFYAPKEQVIATAHAGWPGTSKNIVQQVVDRLELEHKIDPSNLFCAIGPSICGSCYDVSTTKDGRIELFSEMFAGDQDVVIKHGDQTSLSLKKANEIQLINAGVPPEQIDVCEICTYENSDTWASYRRGEEYLSYNIWSFIYIKPE